MAIAATPANAAVQGQIAGTQRTYYGPGGCHFDVALSSPSAGNIQGWMLLNTCPVASTLSLQKVTNGQWTSLGASTLNIGSNAIGPVSKGATGTQWRACVIDWTNPTFGGCSGTFIK